MRRVEIDRSAVAAMTAEGVTEVVHEPVKERNGFVIAYCNLLQASAAQLEADQKEEELRWLLLGQRRKAVMVVLLVALCVHRSLCGDDPSMVQQHRQSS